MGQFNTRRVGRTSLEISELGIGSASVAGNFFDVPDDEARHTITAALDAGITYIDTAPQYGLGRGEHLVGDAMRERHTGNVLATKVGGLLKPFTGIRPPTNWVRPFPFEIIYDYSYDGIMRSYEDSLQRLGLATIDMLYVHDIGVMTHGVERNAFHWKQFTEGGVRAVQELKSSGAVKAIGLGVNEWEVLLDVLAIADWDVFLLAGRYTLLEQTSLDPFLTTCLERGVAIVAGAPFNGGALMGSGTWNYAAAPAEVADRVRRLEQFCAARNVPIGAAALQFPLAHPAVCNVLVGPKSRAELQGILEWWNTAIPADFWQDLAAEGLVHPSAPLPGAPRA